MALACAVDDAHSASPYFLEDLIIAEAPLGIADVYGSEHLIERLGAVSIGFQTALEQAIQTEAASDPRGRSTLRARSNINGHSRRIGNADHVHGDQEEEAASTAQR
jgi:hypothetical protein